MAVEAFVTDDDTWVPAVSFTDQEDSLLLGGVSFPLVSFLTADGALQMAEAADRLIAWATAMKLRALARVEEAMGEESPQRREGQPIRLGGAENHALAVAEVATACARLPEAVRAATGSRRRSGSRTPAGSTPRRSPERAASVPGERAPAAPPRSARTTTTTSGALVPAPRRR